MKSALAFLIGYGYVRCEWHNKTHARALLLSWLREEWQIINKMNECRLCKMLILLLLSPFRDKPGLCYGCSRMLPPEHWFRLAPLSHVFSLLLPVPCLPPSFQ